MEKNKLQDCLSLAEEILKNIELSELPMDKVIYKCLRLVRLLNDENGIELFLYEASGYERDNNGKYTLKAYLIGEKLGRVHYDSKGKKVLSGAHLSEIEERILLLKERLKVAKDPESYGDDFTPFMISTAKNTQERTAIINASTELSKLKSNITAKIYDYILIKYNGIVYENMISDIFAEKRALTEEKLSTLLPSMSLKLKSISDNLKSDNPEDWANAVHSCRRIFQELADSIFPPTEDIELNSGKSVKLGTNNYINRLIQFISSKSSSETYKKVIGKSLSCFGERLDAIYDSTSKGTHSDIDLNEAKTYVISTYLLISDIISLQ